MLTSPLAIYRSCSLCITRFIWSFIMSLFLSFYLSVYGPFSLSNARACLCLRILAIFSNTKHESIIIVDRAKSIFHRLLQSIYIHKANVIDCNRMSKRSIRTHLTFINLMNEKLQFGYKVSDFDCPTNHSVPKTKLCVCVCCRGPVTLHCASKTHSSKKN